MRFSVIGVLVLVLPLLPAKTHAKLGSNLILEDNGIRLKILEEPEDHRFILARFNNPIKNVVLKLGNETIDLILKPQPTHWDIEIPSGVKAAGGEIWIDTIGKPRLAGQPVLVKPEKNGTLKLHAHQATPVGRMLRYEPQPHKNTLGFWIEETDYPEWRFKPGKSAPYKVVVHQGCGKGQGGSQVQLATGNQILPFTVKETGHFQNFEALTIGTLKFENTDEKILQVRVLKKARKAVMDIRLIELIPVN